MAAKHTNLTDKKKSTAAISPQKKEKISKHAKIEKNTKDFQSRVASQSKMRCNISYLSIALMGE
jgi:hypothetical protein